MIDKSDDMVHLQITLPRELKNRIRNVYDQKGIPMSRIVRDALLQHLPGLEASLNIQPPLPPGS